MSGVLRPGPKQERDAAGGNPKSPAGASNEAGKIKHRKIGESRGQDVVLIEQVEHADGDATQQETTALAAQKGPALSRDGDADLSQASAQRSRSTIYGM